MDTQNPCNAYMPPTCPLHAYISIVFAPSGRWLLIFQDIDIFDVMLINYLIYVIYFYIKQILDMNINAKLYNLTTNQKVMLIFV